MSAETCPERSERSPAHRTAGFQTALPVLACLLVVVQCRQPLAELFSFRVRTTRHRRCAMAHDGNPRRGSLFFPIILITLCALFPFPTSHPDFLPLPSLSP